LLLRGAQKEPMSILVLKQTTEAPSGDAAGFTLLEMLIALAVTTVVTGLAITLLAASLNLRAREDRRSDAIADVRRALNTMTGEIANAGYGLPAGSPVNGIVANDSDNTAIRILTNSDRFNGGTRTCCSASSTTQRTDGATSRATT
jgi:prepilin-type N-terminal cleavage/methylation domain-containing protein